jgi:Bacterial PH domain
MRTGDGHLSRARTFWGLVALIAAGVAGVAPVLAVRLAALAHSAGDVVASVVFVGLWLGAGLLALRVGIRGMRAEVVIGRDGVLIRNTFKTHRLPLADVVAFETEPPAGTDPHVPAQGVVRLHDGHRLRLSAFRSEGLASRHAARRRTTDLSGRLAVLNEQLATLKQHELPS